MSVFVWLLMTLRGWVRSRAALHLEVLALRHQLQALERSRPRRLRLTRADCVLWTWVSRAWNGWRAALVIVKPQTVIAWHRQAFPVQNRVLSATVLRTFAVGLLSAVLKRLRISNKDLEAIQKRALEEGLPYQTLIASLLHKFASGRLKKA